MYIIYLTVNIEFRKIKSNYLYVIYENMDIPTNLDSVLVDYVFRC